MRWYLFFFSTLTAFAQSASLEALADRFFDQYFRFSPTQGTSAGFHQYDTQLEDYSKSAVQARTAALHKFEAELVKLPSSPDRELLLSSVRSGLLEFETIRMWQRNPDLYSS